MATAMTAAQWQAQMRKWGVPVSYYGSWAGWGRPGSFAPKGIMIHHTASENQSNSYLNLLFRTGHANLKGPLCHASTAKNGTLYMGATGRANHAGKGALNVYNAIRKSAAPLNGELKPGVDSIDGNVHFYGNEVMYSGSVNMTTAQYNTLVLWCAAVCDFHGWGPGDIIGHREWTRRKIDPGRIGMDKLRRDVAARLKAGPKSGAGSTRFKDVPTGHTFYKEIEWLAAKGITTGYPNGTFGPSERVLREQLATFFYRDAKAGFKDVSKSHPRYGEIMWMGGRGLTTGFGDGTFKPDLAVTRDTLAAFLYRYAGSPDYTPPATPTFNDVGPGTTFHKEIEWMVSQGITEGYNNSDGSKSFRPNQPVLREQFAAFLYRFHKSK